LKKIFIDTGAFLAKELAADQHHEEAVRLWNKYYSEGATFYSSEHILDESMTLFARRTNASWASSWGKDVMGAGIEWLSTEPKDLLQAMDLLKKYADQAVSFTDCLSFVLMRKDGIRDCFAFDRHFQAAGFHAVS
jgi:predicted nucleic acid-binding protein